MRPILLPFLDFGLATPHQAVDYLTAQRRAVSRLPSAISLRTKPVSIRFTETSEDSRAAYVVPESKPRSDASNNSYSNSLAEPSAICTNRAKSRAVPRPHPSAMFAPIEAADRRIWDVSPYCSSRGKSFVRR